MFEAGPGARRDFRQGRRWDRLSSAPLRASWIHSGPGLAHLGSNETISLGRGTPGFYGPEFDSIGAVRAGIACGRRPLSYPSSAGDPSLRTLIAKYCAQFGRKVATEDVLITTGATQAIFVAFAFLRHQQSRAFRCGFITPTWLTLPLNQLALLGGAHREIRSNLTSDNTWQVDLDRLVSACDEGLDASFIVNPSNPTGALLHPRDVAPLLAARVPAIIDVTYDSMVHEGRVAEPFADLLEAGGFLVGSLSKTFAIPGARIGFLVPPPAAVAACERVIETLSMGVSQLSQAFACDCLTSWFEGNTSWFREVRAELALRRAVTTRILTSIGFRVGMPAAGYYSFPQLPCTWAGRAVEFARGLYQRFGVEVVPGPEFGVGYESFLRISFGNPRTQEHLVEALGRIAAFVTDSTVPSPRIAEAYHVS